MKNGAAKITDERERQLSKWSPENDDDYEHGELVEAAISYLCHYQGEFLKAKEFWPWDASEFNPGKGRRQLEKAGALIAAEIDRLDRMGYQR